mgnify:CR=1 FL=1
MSHTIEEEVEQEAIPAAGRYSAQALEVIKALSE